MPAPSLKHKSLILVYLFTLVYVNVKTIFCQGTFNRESNDKVGNMNDGSVKLKKVVTN